MIIEEILKRQCGDRIRISARVTIESVTVGRKVPDELWIEWPSEYDTYINVTPDPYVIMLLPLATVINEPIDLREPISEKLFSNLVEIQAIYRAFWPSLNNQIPVRAETMVRTRADGGLVASFFSGGVDSLYNLAETELRFQSHKTRCIDHLWLVRGMDVPLSDGALWDEVTSRMIDHYSCLPGKKLICSATNIRQFYSHYVDWPRLGFGAAMAGLAKSVAGSFDRVLIGSWGTYPELIPHASHPLLDPLWSCERQDIVHFSCAATRMQKLATVAKWRPELLDAVRVCYRNTGGKYNCGRCEKCLRTRLQLKVLGIDDGRCSFEAAMSSEAVRSIKLPCSKDERYIWGFWQDILAHCREHPELKQYVSAVVRAMRRSRIRCLVRNLRVLRHSLTRRTIGLLRSNTQE